MLVMYDALFKPTSVYQMVLYNISHKSVTVFTGVLAKNKKPAHWLTRLMVDRIG